MTKNPGLQVINAGYPKTGTKTIHEALKILGHNVCDSQENVYRWAISRLAHLLNDE